MQLTSPGFKVLTMEPIWRIQNVTNTRYDGTEQANAAHSGCPFSALRGFMVARLKELCSKDAVLTCTPYTVAYLTERPRTGAPVLLV